MLYGNRSINCDRVCHTNLPKIAFLANQQVSFCQGHKYIKSDMTMKLNVFIIPVQRFDIHKVTKIIMTCAFLSTHIMQRKWTVLQTCSNVMHAIVTKVPHNHKACPRFACNIATTNVFIVDYKY